LNSKFVHLYNQVSSLDQRMPLSLIPAPICFSSKLVLPCDK